MLQQQQILRQQKMAEMLMQKGMEQPQGQMISGHYVAPSIFQNLAGLANTYVGQQGIEKGEQAQLDLAKQLREQGIQETQRLMNTWGGTPAVEKTTELAGPYAGNIPMPTATQEISPAKAGNAKLAFSEALNMQSPQARALLPHLATEAFKPAKWEKDVRYDDKGREIHGWTNVNDPTLPFSAQSKKPEMTVAERIGLNMRGAELADKGIGGFGGYGGGQPTSVSMGQPTNLPMGQPQNQPAIKADPYAPATLPKYEYDPALTPAQNREQALAFSKENQNLVKNAKNSFDLLKSTAETLRTGNPSSGRGENIITGAREFFGGGGETSKADAILTIYGTKLTQQVPRFEGPQSDKDTALYQAAAGDVGNPNKPIATRLAAVETMIDLNKKYYPKGDWSSIDTTMPNTGKVSLGPAKESIANATPIYATNGNQRIMSNDGGKTWQPAR
jgi:hypothetical protein